MLIVSVLDYLALMISLAQDSKVVETDWPELFSK